MDGRGGMARPGQPPPYFMQMGFSPPGAGSHPAFQGPPPGMRPMAGPAASFPPPLQSVGPGGAVASAFQGEATGSVSPASGGNAGGHGGGGGASTETVKRKRGRPRKYGPDAAVGLSGASPLALSVVGLGSGEGSGPSEKRGRGRPPGSGKNQQLASLGGWVSSSAGMGFTPHILTIPEGEDIAAKLLLFSQKGSRAICILSASGFVSRVILRRPSSSFSMATYEGRFEILCLSGSFILSDDGPNNRNGGISVSLCTPDGRVFGGGVEQLIADDPVQVMVGSFNYGNTKAKTKSVAAPPDPGNEVNHARATEQMTEPSPSQNFSPDMTAWTASRQMDIRNAPLDIDLTR